MACTRSEAEPTRLEDDENVDLEKSNVLLMGPTGSGMITMGEMLMPYNILWFSMQVTILLQSVFTVYVFFFNPLKSQVSCWLVFFMVIRENSTCKNSCTFCQCTFCHCGCNYFDTGWWSILHVRIYNISCIKLELRWHYSMVDQGIEFDAGL